MYISHFTRPRVYKFKPIQSVLTTRKYQLIMLGSAMIYAVVYIFAVGITSYYPGFAPLKVTTPIVSANSLGIMIIPGNYIFIFMFYYTIAFLVVSSFLVGINIVLMFYSRNITRSCKCGTITNMSIGSRGMFGILPSFFTSFACCGGGLLALVIGPTAFSSLAMYSSYMAPMTIAVLAAGSVLMSRKISRLKKIIANYDCYIERAYGRKRV
jgi:hypothetical protein